MDMNREEKDAFQAQAAELVEAFTGAMNMTYGDFNKGQAQRALLAVTEVLIKQSQKGRPEFCEEHYQLLGRVLNRTSFEAAAPKQKLQDMYDAAYLMGGASLRSFIRCLESLDRFEAEIFNDSCMLSLTWRGGGFFGGFIFHADCREWSIHT